MQHRAYSLIEVKSVDEDQRVIRGIATTPSVDRMGDVVDPMGVKVASDIPLFLYHDSKQVVGRAKFGRATKAGIPFEARIPQVKEEGNLKARVDEAWQMVRYGLITAVSIGFNVINDAYEKIKETGGYLLKETEVLELSLVPIPAQPDAVIQGFRSMDQGVCRTLIETVKSLDAKHMAASGRTVPDARPPDVSGTTKQPASGGFFSTRSKGNQVKTLAQLQEDRGQKAARLQELVEAKGADRLFTDAEAAEFDAVESELRAIDDEIRTAKAQAYAAGTARSVEGNSASAASLSRGRSPNIIVRNEDPDDAFEGQSWVRQQLARVLSMRSLVYGNFASPAQIAEARWGKTHPKLVSFIKADVAGGGTGSGEWGAELAQSDTRYAGDFIKYLYGKTLFDILPLRSVPSRVHVKGQDGASTGFWVGESKSIPVTTADFSDVELTPLKVGAIAVMSNELILSSSPSAEMMVRDSLVEALSQKVDTTFFGTAAASPGAYPAGILNGLTANTSSGTDADAVRDDLAGLVEYFDTLKYDPAGLGIVTTTTIGNQIQLLTNAFGQPEFPSMGIGGGSIRGYRAYTGHNVGTGDLIMMSFSDIWKIGDSGVRVDTNPFASITMSDAPAGASDTPGDAGTKTVSMFQTDSTAIRVIRNINYAKRRSTAVAYIGNATYGSPASV